MLHFPVLLEESVDFLVNKKEGNYIDCTYGRGGHTQKILETISSNSQLTSFDKDSDAIEHANNCQVLMLLLHRPLKEPEYLY